MTELLEPNDDELLFDETHLQLENAVERLTGRPKHCGRNAYRCLRRAWTLRTIDPEMSVFRAITAEEEAATALMFALKHRRYPGAEHLFPKRHDHKAAWVPFVEAIGQMMANVGVPTPTVRLRKSGPPRIDVSFSAVDLNIPGAREGQELRPDEPLNLVIRTGKSHDAMNVATFGEELAVWAASRGATDVRAWIDEAANLRNRVLYAQDNGIPSASDPRQFILTRRRRVAALLFLTIAVLQADKPQPLGVQALQALLKLLRNIDAGGFDFEAIDAGQDFQIITKLDPVAGRHTTELVPQTRAYTFSSHFTFSWDFGRPGWPRLRLKAQR